MKHHQNTKYPNGLMCSRYGKHGLRLVCRPSLDQWLTSRGDRDEDDVLKDEKGKYILMNLKPVKVYLPERYQ